VAADLFDDLLGAAAVNTRRLRDGFMPWAGLALGTAGFFLAHQLGSDATLEDCRIGSPLVVILGTAIGLAIIAAGAFGSWRVFAPRGEAAARRMIAAVSLMSAALFSLAVILPLVAALVIPRCWA
jgi:hypothetical protein